MRSILSFVEEGVLFWYDSRELGSSGRAVFFLLIWEVGGENLGSARVHHPLSYSRAWMIWLAPRATPYIVSRERRNRLTMS